MTQTLTSAEKNTIDQVIISWQTHNKRVNTVLARLDEAGIKREIAPGRNTGLYLLGHLIAINDNMIELFGLGERQYSKYDVPFVKTPDKSGLEFPSYETLKADWENLNETLTQYFEIMQPQDWFSKHTSVSEEDFAVNPLRNKLNVLIGRTNHQAYHLGQMNLL